jgi:uncharacterized Zn finger protein (UPF0148 family)
MPIKDGEHCPHCGLPNYSGLCPVCRGDEQAYISELAPFFGEFYSGQSSENKRDDEQRDGEGEVVV